MVLSSWVPVGNGYGWNFTSFMYWYINVNGLYFDDVFGLINTASILNSDHGQVDKIGIG